MNLISSLRVIGDKFSFQKQMEATSTSYFSNDLLAKELNNKNAGEYSITGIDAGVLVIDCDTYSDILDSSEESAEHRAEKKNLFDMCMQAHAVSLPDLRIFVKYGSRQFSYRIFPEKERNEEDEKDSDTNPEETLSEDTSINTDEKDSTGQRVDDDNGGDDASRAEFDYFDLENLSIDLESGFGKEMVLNNFRYPWSHVGFSTDAIIKRVSLFIEAYHSYEMDNVRDKSNETKGLSIFHKLLDEQEAAILSHVSMPQSRQSRRSVQSVHVPIQFLSDLNPYSMTLSWIDFQGKEIYYATLSGYFEEYNSMERNYHKYSFPRGLSHSAFLRGNGLKGNRMLQEDEFETLKLHKLEYRMMTFDNHCWTIRDHSTDELLNVLCIKDDMDTDTMVTPVVDVWGFRIQ